MLRFHRIQIVVMPRGTRPTIKLPVVWERKKTIDRNRFNEAVEMMLDEALKRRRRRSALDESRESAILPVQPHK